MVHATSSHPSQSVAGTFLFPHQLALHFLCQFNEWLAEPRQIQPVPYPPHKHLASADEPGHQQGPDGEYQDSGNLALHDPRENARAGERQSIRLLQVSDQDQLARLQLLLYQHIHVDRCRRTSYPAIHYYGHLQCKYYI